MPDPAGPHPADAPDEGHPTPPAARMSERRAIVLGGGGLGVTLLPLFLTGALGVQITEELAIGTAGLGLVVAIHRGSSVTVAIAAGRWVDGLGARRSLRISSLLAAASAFGVALFARDWTTLILWLLLSGLAMSIADPAANRLLVRSVVPARLGRSFGFKQSAPPTSTMLAGLSVPLVALTLGWRAAFVMAGVLALLVAAGTGPLGERPARPERGRERGELGDRRAIGMLALALALGTSTSATVSAFYVVSAVASGTDQRLAGTLLAAASVLTITTRVLLGLIVDRFASGHLWFFAVGQGAGLLGLLLLSSGDPTVMSLGVPIALAGTWGVHGVFWFAVVRAFPEKPGAISGVVIAGGLSGGVLGPLAFGALADAAGFRAAWTLTACLAAAAVLSTAGAVRRLRSMSQGAAS
jgi:MFS family permease